MRPGTPKNTPPGPGSQPTANAAMMSRTPTTNMVHSTTGWSTNLRHCARVIIARMWLWTAVRASGLAGKLRSGLASLRRARGKSAPHSSFVVVIPPANQRRTQVPGSAGMTGLPLVAATIATVAYLGLEVRAVEVQGQRRPACSSSPLSDSPTRQWPKVASVRAAPASMRLSVRGFHAVIRVARTIADLAVAEQVGRIHVAEALSYRRQAPRY